MRPMLRCTLETPYSGAFADPSASGVPGVGMNCTGFVGHVLMACGADLTPIVEGDMPAYLAKAWTNLSCWEWWLDHHPDIISYRFDSTAQALSSGILEKGDIIIMSQMYLSGMQEAMPMGTRRTVILVFSGGDDPHENKFWHSSHETTGLRALTGSYMPEQIPEIRFLSWRRNVSAIATL